MSAHPQEMEYTNNEIVQIEQKEQIEIIEQKEQTNIVYLDHDGDDNGLITKKVCCSLVIVMIGIILSIIGFLWLIDPTPYTDCKFSSEYRCDDGGHDIPERTINGGSPNGADGPDLNETALGIFLAGLLIIAIGSYICWKGSKEGDNDQQQQEKE